MPTQTADQASAVANRLRTAAIGGNVLDIDLLLVEAADTICRLLGALDATAPTTVLSADVTFVQRCTEIARQIGLLQTFAQSEVTRWTADAEDAEHRANQATTTADRVEDLVAAMHNLGQQR